ncbi:MAG TPA: hypothetical protein VFU38_07820 [Candidatus Krumholzibacteria bacterium]|nr:hypothetical protein [Candidatus Krumholzibacteria bacterium]
MRVHPALALSGVLSLAMLAEPARAEPPARKGPAVGFGLGGGSVSWLWPDDERRGEWSGSGNARVAWALNREVLLGVEMWAWSKDYAIGSIPEDVPVEVRFWAANAAATYFPGDTGFYLRGGLGWGQGRVEVTPPPSVVDFPIHGEKSAGGLSLLGAMGYELGVTPRLALGGAIHAVYLAIDDDRFQQVFGYGITGQMNWYW